MLIEGFKLLFILDIGKNDSVIRMHSILPVVLIRKIDLLNSLKIKNVLLNRIIVFVNDCSDHQV